MQRQQGTTGGEPIRAPLLASSILVVDDQEEALISTQLLLEREGYQVITAESGREALSVFSPGLVQLVIVDYFMPGMNGENLVKHIRSRDGDVQILLQTGYSGEKPPLETLRLLDIQGYHNKLDGPERLLLWVEAKLKAAEHIKSVREAERTAAHYRTQLRNLSARLLRVQEEERERVSRELHDHLGQLLTSIGMTVEWARSHCPEEVSQVRQRLHEAMNVVREAIDATRALSTALRPAVLRNLGLEDALKDFITDFERRSGLGVRSVIRLRGEQVPAETATNIYRIVQEALNNVARHAGATEVTVDLLYTDGGIIASVADNGRGFEVERLSGPQSLGLIGMRERADLIGGKLDICSTPSVGTTVDLEIPIRREGGTH